MLSKATFFSVHSLLFGEYFVINEWKVQEVVRSAA